MEVGALGPLSPVDVVRFTQELEQLASEKIDGTQILSDAHMLHYRYVRESMEIKHVLYPEEASGDAYGPGVRGRVIAIYLVEMREFKGDTVSRAKFPCGALEIPVAFDRTLVTAGLDFREPLVVLPDRPEG